MKRILASSSLAVSFAVFTTLTMTLFFRTLANAEEQPRAVGVIEEGPASANQSNAVPGPDPSWNTGLTLYLWFPGVHGTSGAKGHNVDFRASAGDLLSNFRFGLMGALDANRGRFVILAI